MIHQMRLSVVFVALAMFPSFGDFSFFSARGGFLGSAFGRTDFSRIFIFEPQDFFADLVAGFFLLIFVGKVPRKILQENPRQNPPQILYNKNPRHISAEGPGQEFHTPEKPFIPSL